MTNITKLTKLIDFVGRVTVVLVGSVINDFIFNKYDSSFIDYVSVIDSNSRTRYCQLNAIYVRFLLAPIAI